ncbi:MAG: 4Fe-4S binding protein [Pseudomonadota bacterium]
MISAKTKNTVRNVLWPLVLITIIGGQFYPWLGFIVPIVMLTGIIGAAIYGGRFICGWICPRGSFYDLVISKISRNKTIPKFFRNSLARYSLLVLLMGFMILQIALDAGNITHWGVVFVRLCAVTTAIGVMLAIIFHPRTWCTFCPMGTIQSHLGKKKTISSTT